MVNVRDWTLEKVRKNTRAVVTVSLLVLACTLFASAGTWVGTRQKPAQANVTTTTFTFGTVGDHARGTSTSNVFRAAGASQLDFFLSLGDLSYSDPLNYSEMQWCQFVKDNFNLGATKPLGDVYGETYPFEIISGNHESDFTQNDGLIDNFVAPGCLPNRLPITTSPNLGTNPSATGNYAKEYFFDYPSTTPLARFILVDPGINFYHGGTYDFSAGTPRYNWLSNAIDEARANGIKWVIVANHYNYISAGIKNNQTGGTDYFNLLLEKKVDLILQGHDHNYQRSKQFAHSAACPSLTTAAANLGCVVDDGSDNAYEKGKGPILIINGAGGNGLYTLDPNDTHVPYFASLMGGGVNPTHGFSKITINNTSLVAEFVPAYTGSFTDNFVISEATVIDTTPPTAPTNLSATAPSSTRVDLSWTASTDNTGVTGYSVYRNGSLLSGNVTGTSHSDTTVSPQTTYSYTVVARDAVGNVSEASPSVEVTTPASTTATLTFSLSNDATISALYPTRRYGGNVKLLVDNSPINHSLLKFTVSGINGRTVDSAKLRLYVVNPSFSGGSIRRLVSNNWSQSTVTWNTAPAQNPTILSSLGRVALGTWVEFDLTSTVRTDGTYSFRLSSASSDGADYSSREATTNKPQVVLTVR